MENFWLRSLIVTLACLSFAACGKSKDGSSVSSAPADTKTPTSTPEPKPASPEATKNDKNKEVTPVVPRKRERPKLQQKDGKPDDGNKGPSDSANPGPVNPSGRPPAVVNRGNDKSAPPQESPKKASPQTLNSMLGQAEEFSGTAPDGLRELLIEQQMRLPEDQKLRNAKFASTIRKARLDLNNNIGKVQMVLTIGKNDVGFIGSIKNDQTVDFASNAHGFSGTLTCLDQRISNAPTCETSLAEIKYNDNATVKIIFRRTSIAMRLVFPPQNCMTQACEDFYNLSRYTERQIEDSNTLKLAVMESSEIIFGRTDFSLVLLTNENQIMRISGPMANPKLYPTLDTPMDRTLLPSDLVDSQTREARRTQMNEELHDVRLVLNDGQGHLNFLVKMKMQANGKADGFQIRLERKFRPITLPVELTRTAGAGN